LLPPSNTAFVAVSLVIDLRGGDADHAPTGEACPLGEVETSRNRRETLIQTLEPLGKVTTNQHRSGPDKSHLADNIILLEIDLPLIEPAVRLAKHVSRLTNRLQLVTGSGHQKLRTTESCIPQLQFVDQSAQSIRARAGIGVQNPQVIGVVPAARYRLFEGLLRRNAFWSFITDITYNHDFRGWLIHLSTDDSEGCPEIRSLNSREENRDHGCGGRCLSRRCVRD
jgi:hypothetical protein